ncbi:hypothetical protein F5887DRAFT_1081650 [Amanita rubescens]|nr:hypothetical protein F5887DRAFT_1081650 [Amanita rubescens]
MTLILKSTPIKTKALENYYQATSPLAITLAEYFKVLFPKAYLKLKKAFDDIVWVKDDHLPWEDADLEAQGEPPHQQQLGPRAHSFFPLWVLPQGGNDNGPVGHKLSSPLIDSIHTLDVHKCGL